MNVTLRKLTMLEKMLAEKEENKKVSGDTLTLEEKAIKSRVTNVLAKIR